MELQIRPRQRAGQTIAGLMIISLMAACGNAPQPQTASKIAIVPAKEKPEWFQLRPELEKA